MERHQYSYTILTVSILSAACTPPGDDEAPTWLPERYASAAAALDGARHAAVAIDGVHAFAPMGGAIAIAPQGDVLLRPRSRPLPVRMALVDYGDGAAPAVGHLEARGDQVRLERGALTEWYRHGTDGVEMGFVLRAPPVSGPTDLVFDLEGVVAHTSGSGVVLEDDHGRPVAHLGAPWAADARDEELPISWVADGEALALAVDTRGARWPVRVDPLVSLVEAVATSPDATAGFGEALATDGDLVVVGAPGLGAGDGLVVVLERNEQGTGAWGVAAAIPSPPDDIGFGTSVALDYPRMVIGSVGDASTPGAVRLYEHGASGWVETHAADGSVGNDFASRAGLVPQGVIVGEPGANEVTIYAPLTGGTLARVGPLAAVVGAGSDLATSWPFAIVGASGSASASIYAIAYPGLPWASSSGPGDHGAAVDIDGLRAVVGAPSVGQVTVIDLTPTATGYTATERLLPTDAIDDLTGFGSDVAVHGDVIAVTDAVDAGRVHVFALDRDDDLWRRTEQRVGQTVALEADRLIIGRPDVGTGEVEVLHRDADTLTFTAEHVAPSAGASSGRAVAVEGDLLVTGAPNWVPPFISSSEGGTVYTLQREQGQWTYLANLAVADADPDSDPNLFGSALALDGGHLLVGDPAFDGGRGRAHLFAFEGDGWRAIDTLDEPDATTSSGFGSAVALSQGVLAVGGPGHSGNGAVQLATIDLADDALGPTGLWLAPSPGSGAGAALALHGDRLAVGAPNHASQTGQVHLLDLSGDPLSATVALTLAGTAIDARCGYAVALDADTLAVGCRSRALEGEVRLYTDDDLGWRHVTDIDAGGPAGIVDGFGAALALEGSRLFVGAPDAETVTGFERNQGGPDAWGARPGFVLGGASGDGFGRALALDSDTLVIGAPQIDFAAGIFGNGYVQAYDLGADQPPQAIADTFVAMEDTPTGLDVLRNDLDGDGDAMIPIVVTPPTLGDLAVDGTGALTYTPHPDAWGADSFTYAAVSLANGAQSAAVRADIDLQPVNDAPVLPGGVLAYATVEEVDLVVDAADGLLQGVTDVDGPTLEVVDTGVLATDAGGSVDVAPDGSFVYTPVIDFAGLDAFRVAIGDGLDEADALREVTIEVIDAPEAPELLPQTFAVTARQPLVADAPGLAAGGTFPPGERAFDVLSSQGGYLEAQGSGAFVYEPPLWLDEGVEVMTVQARMVATGVVSDPVAITFEITAAPSERPIAVDDHWVLALGDRLEIDLEASGGPGGVLRNDIAPAGEALVDAVVGTQVPAGLTLMPHGGFLYEPPSPGTFTFDYFARTADATSEATATVTFVVLPADDGTGSLVASDDTYALPPDGHLEVAAAEGVLANDSAGSTVALLVQGPPRGVLSLAADGGFVYDGPAPPIPLTFTYRASDGARASDPTTVTLEPTPPPADTNDTGRAEPADTGLACDRVLYTDLDGDGFGDEASDPVLACRPVPGRAEQAGDCDDGDASAHPGAEEVPDDGIDQDCDGRDASLSVAGGCRQVPAPGGLLLLLPLPLFLRRKEAAC